MMDAGVPAVFVVFAFGIFGFLFKLLMGDLDAPLRDFFRWMDARAQAKAARAATRRAAAALAHLLHRSNAWHCGCPPCVAQRAQLHGDLPRNVVPGPWTEWTAKDTREPPAGARFDEATQQWIYRWGRR